MREIFLKGLLIGMILSWVLIPNLTQAEEIRDFKVDISIEKNSDIEIKETIVYDFGYEMRHGIYRLIPYKYKTKDKIVKLDLEVKSVENERKV
jgi:hypothetical protein